MHTTSLNSYITNYSFDTSDCHFEKEMILKTELLVSN